MDTTITRRDFVQGVATSVAASVAHRALPDLARGTGSDAAATQDAPGYYPPALTGLRGSGPGSFEVAHALRDGDFWKSAGQPADTGETYDLIVVGAGLSGLAAAHFHQRRAPSARILVLDNHDDFGGHAQRDEFRPGGRLLLSNGGSASIESPFAYSRVARELMNELGVDPRALTARCDVRDSYPGLTDAVFFDRETFGADRFVAGAPDPFSREDAAVWSRFVARTPLPAAAQRDILRLQTAPEDFLPGLSSDQKKDRLSRISYRDFLLRLAKADPAILPFYQTAPHDLYGVGIDAVPALDCWGLSYPGFDGLRLAPGPYPRMGYTARGYATPRDPYRFHFPDGNATIARLLVRALVPAAVPGNTVDDVVTARVDYGKLDRAGSPVRIRLNATVVRVGHAGARESAKEVEVTWARGGAVASARGRGAVLACWNSVASYLCPELPEKQKQAMQYGAKVPLVYTTVALRDGTAFEKLGAREIACPGMFHTTAWLDRAVAIGAYRCPASAREPALVRMTRTPCAPGLSERDQHRAGRAELLATSFEEFERNIRDQLARALAGGGFDPARDIEAITVNRWPHGYAPENNSLFEAEKPEALRPHVIGRARFGRISIANSDAGGGAYTDVAIEQAHRAIKELLG
jgi:spermidine dehydrogenase